MSHRNRADAASPTRRELLASSAPLALAVGTAVLAGGGLLAASAVVLREKSRAPTPQDFWAQGDGLHDDTGAFLKLALSGNYVRVPMGSYVVRQTIPIQPGQVWQFENARILYQGEGPLFDAQQIDDWALLGVARLQGSRADKTRPSGVGLRIDTCKRFKVNDLQFSKFAGAGLLLEGRSDTMSPRGDRGQFSNLDFHDCQQAIEIQANASSEYNTFTNTQVTACDQGMTIGAGNNQFVGGNVVDCGVGVVLTPGFNHGHGGFHGFNLTHASDYNLVAHDIESGFTFNGCHFHGDAGSRGAIHLRDCKGILIQGGQINCALINEGKRGKNFVVDTVVTGEYFNIASSSGDQAGIVCRNVLKLDGTDACNG